MKPLTKLCRRHHTTLWGQPYFVTPALVNWIHGDGLQVIYFAPLATRPRYYLVRIDSKIELSNWAKEGASFHDQVLDDLYGEIEDQFGRHEDEWEHENGRTYLKHQPFPALDDSCGSSWGKVERLTKPDMRHWRRISYDITRAKAWEN